jgi:di/tricarboxylate transporter
LYRLALWAIATTRGGYVGQVIALGIAGLLIGPAVPNATSRVTLVAPAVRELVDALGYKPRSRASAGLAMAVLVGFGFMTASFLTSSTTAVLVYAVLPEATRASVDWVSWALRGAPANTILFGGLLAFVLWYYRPRPDDREGAPSARADGSLSADGIALQRALLGPPTFHERVSFVVTIALLAGFVTQPFHGVHPAWVGVAALALLAATGTLGADGLRNVNWSFILLFGILTSMGAVFAQVGLDAWLAGLVTGALGGLTAAPVLFLGALAVLCLLVSFVLRWQAAAPLFTIALAPVAAGAGIDPFVIGLVATIACNGFFLPYQSTIYLAMYHGTDGRLFTHQQARPLALAYAAFTVLAVCAAVPAWRAMGLL